MYCKVHFGKPVYLDHMREKYERKKLCKDNKGWDLENNHNTEK